MVFTKTKRNLLAFTFVMSQIGTIATAHGAVDCRQLFQEQTASTQKAAQKTPLLSIGLTPKPDGAVALTLSNRTSLAGRALNLLGDLIGKPLGVPRTEDGFRRLSQDNRTDISYFEKMIEALDMKVVASKYGLDKIPKTGPVIFIANHPLSGMDGVAIAAYIAQVRPDMKIVLTSLLKDIPGLAEHAIFANPYGGAQAKIENTAAKQQMQQTLENGGSFLIFPAGSVSVKEKLSDPVAVDESWKMGVVAMLRKVPNAQVVPIFVDNQPSHAVSVAKKIHPIVKLVFILKDITSNVGQEINMHLGSAIKPEDLAKLSSSEEVLAYLRARTYLMSDDLLSEKTASKKEEAPRELEEIGAAVNPALVNAELAQHEVLFDISPDRPNKGVKVYMVRGSEIPNTLLELGRLREITFRSVGEGSGKAYDVDQYDQHYYHLVAVDKESGRISGAYRLGRLDEILQTQGSDGIYSTEFFKYDSLLRGELGKDGIELGRSFVLPEFQRRSLTLPALWGAIGRFVVLNPHYKHLIGPVSISNEYKENTKLVLVNFLRKYYLHEQSGEVTPRNPPHLQTLLKPEEVTALLKVNDNLNSMNALIRDIEGDDNAKMPPLIPMYIGMGAKFLGFDKDTSFNTVDGLIWVDFTKTPFDNLKKYLGEDGARQYRAYHGIHD